MPLIVFDTGFLYSLVVDRAYSDAARDHWDGVELWVPESVVSEMQYRIRTPTPAVPPELPNHALGLIGSTAWGIVKVELTDDEQRDAEQLAQRIGGGPLENRGECEGAVLIARRGPGILATDDTSSIPVLASFVSSSIGSSIRYVTTSSVLDELVSVGKLNASQRAVIGRSLGAKGRPYL